MGEGFEDIVNIANEDINNTPYYERNIFVDIPNANEHTILESVVHDLIKDGLVIKESE